MTDERRNPEIDDRRETARVDRRARSRGGRRADEAKQPWWMRRRLWLGFASVVYVGWRRILGRKASG
jgi:hypothetical protein